MGVGQSWIGRHVESLSLFGRASDLASRAGHVAIHTLASVNVAEAYTNIGSLARAEGNAEVAQAMFEHAEARYGWLERHLTAVGFRQLQPQLAGLRASTALNLGHVDQAIISAEQALVFAHETGSPEALAVANGRAGEVFLGLGEWNDRAASSRQRLLRMSSGTNMQIRRGYFAPWSK